MCPAAIGNLQPINIPNMLILQNMQLMNVKKKISNMYISVEHLCIDINTLTLTPPDFDQNAYSGLLLNMAENY